MLSISGAMCSPLTDSTSPASTIVVITGSIGSFAKCGMLYCFASVSTLLSPKIECSLPQSGHF